jgi:hypothetical protein
MFFREMLFDYAAQTGAASFNAEFDLSQDGFHLVFFAQQAGGEQVVG